MKRVVKASRTSVAAVALLTAVADPQTMTPEALSAKIRSETARWGKVVKAAGLKAQ